MYKKKSISYSTCLCLKLKSPPSPYCHSAIMLSHILYLITVKGMVNCQNSQAKGLPEFNSARG